MPGDRLAKLNTLPTPRSGANTSRGGLQRPIAAGSADLTLYPRQVFAAAMTASKTQVIIAKNSDKKQSIYESSILISLHHKKMPLTVLVIVQELARYAMTISIHRGV
jgi:hypothetical protein